jgi:hypothetical protein
MFSLCRFSTRYRRNVVLISLRGEDVPFGRFKRWRYPVESAFEMKNVESNAVE